MNNLDPDMKSLFDMAGISTEQLEDENTRKALYDVIQQKGGLEAVKKEVGNRRNPAPPPPPSKSASAFFLTSSLLFFLSIW